MDHLTEQDLAKRWNIAPSTLRGWRTRKKGPTYIKIEDAVRYRLTDVEEYEKKQLRKPLNQGEQDAKN